MRVYRCKLDGREIRTDCIISAENWEEVLPASPKPAPETLPKKKKASKKAVKENAD